MSRAIARRIATIRALGAAVGMAAIGLVGPAVGQPVTGRPVPALAAFDTLMIDFMADNGIEAGVLGVMKDDGIVYLRGFGWRDAGVPMPENAMVRIASISKMITAAATRRLIDDGAFTLESRAFDLGQPGGGILPSAPFPGLVDLRLRQVTVEHLLRHRGGWDRSAASVGDLTYRELQIAGEMNVPSPPGRDATMRWILGRPLQFTPGNDRSYSNIGSLALGLIVERESGMDLVSYARQNVLTPEMWVPATEFRLGASFREWGAAREPWYRALLPVPNVFSWFGPPIVNHPYGGWDHEARVGQGGIVSSAVAMLQLARHHHLGAGSTLSGLPITDADPLDAPAEHGGMLPGANATLWQRPDGVNVFVFFNSSPLPELNFDTWEFETGHFGNRFRVLLDPLLDAGTIAWPSTTSDGAWTLPTAAPPAGIGAYDAPYRGFAHAMASTTAGTRLRLLPGTSAWTGTIDRRTQLTAPLGPVTIGQ